MLCSSTSVSKTCIWSESKRYFKFREQTSPCDMQATSTLVETSGISDTRALLGIVVILPLNFYLTFILTGRKHKYKVSSLQILFFAGVSVLTWVFIFFTFIFTQLATFLANVTFPKKCMYFLLRYIYNSWWNLCDAFLHHINWNWRL